MLQKKIKNSDLISVEYSCQMTVLLFNTNTSSSVFQVIILRIIYDKTS